MCHSDECGCGHPTHHTPGRASHHHWGCCCSPGHGMRQFPSREEILTELGEYLKQLQAEVKGVEERIADFKKAG